MAALTATLLSTCSDDEDGEVPLESACSSTKTVRIADLPPGWPSTDPKAAGAALSVIGDRLLVRWEALGTESGPGDIFVIDPCGPTTEILAPGALGIGSVDVLKTPDGLVVYGLGDEQRTLYRLDHFETPGIDGPQAIFRFDGYASGFPYADLLAIHVQGAPNFGWQAAGIGSKPGELWIFHHGDTAPTRVAVDVVAHRYFLDDDGSLAALVLTDAGVLSWYEPFPGPGEVLQTGVRYAKMTPDRRFLVWQVLGDGVAESVFLRDLDTGEDVELTVNDFVVESFGKSSAEGPSADYVGTWVAPDDSSAVALIGPDTRILRAFLTSTGAALDVPEHQPFAGEFYGIYRDTFELSLPDPSENVAALWTPRTGDLMVVYRGPDSIDFVDRHADGFEYRRTTVALGQPADNFSLWALDRISGRSTLVLPRAGSWIHTLDDDRLLYGVSDEQSADELTVFDPDTRVFKAFVSRARRGWWEYMPGLGVAYLDLYSSSPGLYLAPIPPK